MAKIIETFVPTLPEGLPYNSQWLHGIGAGSWFTIKSHESNYWISRFNQDGKIECEGEFNILNMNKREFDLNKPFNFTYLSHCSRVTIIQDGVSYNFEVNNR